MKIFYNVLNIRNKFIFRSEDIICFVADLHGTPSQILKWQLRKYHRLNIKPIAKGLYEKSKYLHDLNMKMQVYI